MISLAEVKKMYPFREGQKVTVSRRNFRRRARVIYSRPGMFVVEYLPEKEKSIFFRSHGIYREAFTINDLLEKDYMGNSYLRISLIELDNELDVNFRL